MTVKEYANTKIMDLKVSGAFPFFLLLTAILSVQFMVCLCSSNNEKSPECNKPFQCGIIRDVSYPFRQRGSPQYCGQPGFELNCENGTPMITIMSQSYQVRAFNMSIQSLTVAPPDDYDLFCPRHLVNISLNLGPFHAAWNTEKLTLYYDCPTLANQSIGLSNHKFNCKMNGTGVQVGYFVVTSAFDNLTAATKDALRSCRSSVIVLAFASIVQLLERKPSADSLVMALGNGFGLQWSKNGTVPAGPSVGSSSKLKLTIGLGVAAATVVVVSIIAVTFRLKKVSTSRRIILMNFQKGTKRKHHERIEAFILQYGSELAPKRYSCSDIKKITKSFQDELGHGGFGTVYKGELPDGRLVAVKVLSESKGGGEEFINEVASISRTSHVNIVTFIGFCYEGSMRALIYEFMSNGSLDKFICHQTSSPEKCHQLELKTLYEIAIRIARGLEC